MKPYILSIDQGTTGTTAAIYTQQGAFIGAHSVDFAQHFPEPGWVEHEPEDIWRSVREAVQQALRRSEIGAREIAGIGITNQRETTLLWARDTGLCVHRAIVWQCRRTAEVCNALREAGHADEVRRTTGLVLDPYFSGTKLAWLLDKVPDARARAERAELAFGTVDSFLVWRLSGGQSHVTDASNASRTMLASLRGEWCPEMIALLRIPPQVLPQIVDSAGVVAHTRGLDFLPDGIPIAGIAGDQQAALFGQGCVNPGDAKCTYGTGAFVLLNTGERPIANAEGLLTTIAWRLAGKLCYALEGSSFVAGAAVQWLRDGLGLIEASADVEALASSVPDAAGVVFVPALTGLGAPFWRPEARGMIGGLTRGTTRAHIARATLEGIAHSVADLLDAMTQGGTSLRRLRVDGGASANNLLMQMQADYTQLRVERPSDVESTARGAALLAVMGLNLEAPKGAAATTDSCFEPLMGTMLREEYRRRWYEAVARC